MPAIRIIDQALRIKQELYVDGRIFASNGTEASPSIVVGEDGHGFYRNSATSIGLSIAGTGSWRLSNASGNVVQTFFGASSNSYFINTNQTNAEFRITAGNASTNGGNVIFYAGSHATKAGDFELRDGASNAIAFDKSAELITISKDTTVSEDLTVGGRIAISTDGTAANPSLKIGAEDHGFYRPTSVAMSAAIAGVESFRFQNTGDNPTLLFVPTAGNLGTIRMQISDGAMYYGSTTGISAGGQLRAYGNGHATKADYRELTRGNTVDAFWDGSGNMTQNEDLTVGGTATINDYTLPSSDGTSGQVMTTNGAGVVSFQSPTFTEPGVHTVSSANYTILDADGYGTILVTTGASDRTITLPDASSNTNRKLLIKKVDSGTGEVIVARAGTDTIDGETSYTIMFENNFVELISDGSNWFITNDKVYIKEIIDLTSSGDFTGGSLSVERVNKQIVISAVDNPAFSSNANPDSAAGLIPEWARPSGTKMNLHAFSSSNMWRTSVKADGSFSYEIRDYSGTLSASTSDGGITTISYSVD